ncbi:MAG TPA: HPr-rel-A system PqqD family peptide chaperone [Casimicrobiaceae bacterium]|nr:HPr-rel-A system PqqD family peptide chaperone [Casimicrobiaceae bacterium]
MDPIPLHGGESLSVADGAPEPRWRIPAGQHFVIEDFDDGIVMFDALVGATHLLNVSAADTLAIVRESPGLATAAIHRCLLERLELGEEALPLAALEELLWRLEDLNLVTASAA